MYLYYVVATEQTKDRKGNIQETEDVRAIIARNEQHLKERCQKLFIRFGEPQAVHTLNKDWDNWKEPQ